MADRRRLRRIVDRLASEYGRPILRPHGGALDELILTVLSQNTNDRNRDVAYARLRERFSSWDEVREAPLEEVEEALRPGGLAPTKSVRIRQILDAIGDDDLGRLADAPLDEARRELCALPGVGRKTAACVLLFALGRPDPPVDTHVYRVGGRLGLWPEKAPLGLRARRARAPLRARPAVRLRGTRAADPPRAPNLRRPHPALRRVPAGANVPGGPAAAGARMSETALRRTSEAALIGIAAVWGVTFVMVQDAIAFLPTMAFLAYRFIPAALIVAVIFWRPLRRLPAAGWRAGLVMGFFLAGGYIFQTLGLEQTTASNTGFITGLFVVLTPVLGAIFLRQRVTALVWIAAGVSMFGLWLLSGAGGEFELRGDGLVLLCAFSLAAHILATARAVVHYDVGALLAVQLGVVGMTCLVIGALAGQLEKPEGCDGLVGADRDLARGDRARVLRAVLRTTARAAGAHGADPRLRARLRRPLRLAAQRRAADRDGLAGRRADHGGDRLRGDRAPVSPAAAAARGLMHKLLLAVPFLIGIAVLQGLTVEIDTFHGSDAAVYQLPTIELFRERLDFSDYPSAQTPLFHVVMTAWGKLVGFDLWKLRLLNVAISYGAALALLRLLRRATPLAATPAFALTLAFALSPYFFGASFTLLTDNLAILFALLAMERIHAYSRTGSMAAFALACLWIAGAVLTRQSFLWLVLVAAFYLLRRRAGGQVLAGAALLALALAPLAALVIEWNGLVPPGADPLSCGLCTDRPGFGRDVLTLRTVGFSLALLGAYAVVLLGPVGLSPPAPPAQSGGPDGARRARLAGRAGARQLRPRRRPAPAARAAAGRDRRRRRSGAAPDLTARVHPDRPRPGRRRGLPVAHLGRAADRCSGRRCSSGCSCRSGRRPARCSCGAPGRARCRASTWARSCSRRCPWGSSTRSTSTRSCCSPWRSSPGAATFAGAATTQASCSSAWARWPTRSASRDEPYAGYWISTMSITNTSVSFGPITGGEPCAP